MRTHYALAFVGLLFLSAWASHTRGSTNRVTQTELGISCRRRSRNWKVGQDGHGIRYAGHGKE